MRRLPRLSGLLLGTMGPSQVQSSPFLPCSLSSLCLTRSRLLFLLSLPVLLQVLSLFPAAPCWLLPAQLLSLHYLQPPGLPPPFQQLVQVLLIKYNPGTGCMTLFQPDIRKTARLHSFPYGSRMSGTPPPPIVYPLAKSLYICPITYS